MKKIILLLVGIVFSLSVQAQSNITIGLVMPTEELNGIRPDAFSLLQSKLDKVFQLFEVYHSQKVVPLK